MASMAIAVETIAVMTIVGSGISSQLVGLEIADVSEASSVSADDASWVACIAGAAEVVAIPIATTANRPLGPCQSSRDHPALAAGRLSPMDPDRLDVDPHVDRHPLLHGPHARSPGA
jgi:hypothetical protein